MAKKAREKTEEAGSASVYPYGSVLGYELVTSQPSRPITVVWPEYRTWFIGHWVEDAVRGLSQPSADGLLTGIIVNGFRLSCRGFVSHLNCALCIKPEVPC